MDKTWCTALKDSLSLLYKLFILETLDGKKKIQQSNGKKRDADRPRKISQQRLLFAQQTGEFEAPIENKSSSNHGISEILKSLLIDIYNVISKIVYNKSSRSVDRKLARYYAWSAV